MPQPARPDSFYDEAAASVGLVINPKARKGVINGLNRRNEFDNNFYCPCRPGDVSDDAICNPCRPCRETGACCCNFMVQPVVTPAPDELDSVRASETWDLKDA